ncbi:LIM domain kinase 1 isoform X2, partial [Paramuricea clavata]
MSAMEAVNCSGCKFPIQKDVHSALGLKWHRNCFRCSECLSTIPLHYMPRDNVLYCKKDYILKFGEHCQRCVKQITGPVMVAGEQKYHTECFVCTKCLKFIGYGDEYMLVERHNLYCNDCYKHSILPAISTPSVDRQVWLRM